MFSIFVKKQIALKSIFLFILSLFFLVSCKTQSVIVTSKSEAIRKNNHQVTIKKINLPEKKVIVETEKPTKKIIIENEVATENFQEETPVVYAENPIYDSYFADQLVTSIKENIGSRYKTGGTSKSGFDCSGLMCATFGEFDIKLPRTSNEQSKFGLRINPIESKKGDLIFFRTNGRSVINHVGMIVEVNDDEIKFVHSSSSSGVMVSSTKENYYKKTFAQVNRVLK